MLSSGVTVTLMMLILATELAVFFYRCIMFRELKKKKFPNIIGMSVIATSILFTVVAGTLMFFVGSGLEAVCDVTILLCIVVYMLTKGQLYIFFIERMHIVHKSPSQTRIDSPFYIFNICLLIPYLGIFVLLIIYRISYVGDDQKCRHGLGRESSLAGMIYDSMFSIYSVIVFVWPLCKSQSLQRSEGLRLVVKKNIIGSVVSTVSTFLNIFSMYYNEGQDTGYCLLCCTADIMVNVLVMNYLISGSGGSRKGRQDYETKASATGHHKFGESEVLLHISSKVYPFESSGSSPIGNSEVDMTLTTLNTANSECVATLRTDDIVEEIV